MKDIAGLCIGMLLGALVMGVVMSVTIENSKELVTGTEATARMADVGQGRPFTICQMQEFLKDEGYYFGPVDCRAGSGTIEAWNKYSCQVKYERAMEKMP